MLEVPVPSYDPVAWKIEHGLMSGPEQRVLVEAPDDSVGSIDTFFVRDDDSDTGFTELTAELEYQNELVSMWVEDGLAVNTEALVIAGDRFAREIVPAMRELFGQEWSRALTMIPGSPS